MSAADRPAPSSFVVLLVGKRRLALPSDAVIELAPPVRLHRFPHTSPLISGVIVRRGRVIPVFDAASVLAGHSTSTQRFYMVARRRIGKIDDFAALPLNGECELTSGDLLPPDPDSPEYITGRVTVNDVPVDVLDFSAFASLCASAATEPDSAAVPQ
jgi:CheW-like protein